MWKNPVFTLVLGLIVGLAVGFLLGEKQSVPPQAVAQNSTTAAVPEGHSHAGSGAPTQRLVLEEAGKLEQMLAQNPGDARIMVALGNLYYDAQQWPLARTWYERALENSSPSADVLTDLAVVLRNLGEFEASVERLDEALAVQEDHWKAAFNKVVVLNFDLHRHDEAIAAFERLKELKASNPEIPDLSSLELEIRQHSSH